MQTINIEETIKGLEAGKTYKFFAKKYKVAVSTVCRLVVKHGKANGWKRELIAQKREETKARIYKAICTNPNLRDICKKESINYWTITGPQWGVRVRPVKCYIKARQTCKDCGKEISKWTKRGHTTRYCKECYIIYRAKCRQNFKRNK
jgi:dolichyl-phosphate-mannose--protein O-mannosyl transferase